jgi:hypothetical protein
VTPSPGGTGRRFLLAALTSIVARIASIELNAPSRAR